MNVSNLRDNRLGLDRRAGLVIAAAGLVSLLATYWDDAWHTDIGRDDATIPPHLLLYGSAAVAGLLVAGWGLLVLTRTRSLIQTLRYRPLLVAGLGGVATLVSAPIDAAWHSAYGRDAVLWSPPHMLVVFASVAMVCGVLTGLRPGSGPTAPAAVAAVLLGSAVVAVLEYETDVPQFSETLYLPVLLVATLTAAAAARALVPARLPVTTMVAIYVVFRFTVIAVLALLGRTTPDIPLAVAGLALVDLPLLATWQRFAAGAAGVSALAWIAAATGLASQSPTAVAPVAIPVTMVAVLLIVVPNRRARAAVLTLIAIGVGGLSALLAPDPASAHDPGQGEDVMSVQATGASDGRGGLTITVAVRDCAAVKPVRAVARRAGQTIIAGLNPSGSCRFDGALKVPDNGTWFTYAEFDLDDPAGPRRTEVWLPLDASRSGTSSSVRTLYLPAGTGTADATQIGVGALIYVIGGSLVAFALWQVRRYI